MYNHPVLKRHPNLFEHGKTKPAKLQNKAGFLMPEIILNKEINFN